MCGGSADLAEGRARRIEGAVGRVREDCGSCRSFKRKRPRGCSGLRLVKTIEGKEREGEGREGKGREGEQGTLYSPDTAV